MPRRHLRYGDTVTIESPDGDVVITKGKGGNLTIDAPHARIGRVVRKIRDRPRLQPENGNRIDFVSENDLQS